MAEGAAPGPRFWHADRIAGLALVAIAAFVMWEVRVLPLGTLRNPGPGYYPLALAALLAAFGAIVAWRASTGPVGEPVRWPELQHAIKILVVGGFAAFALEPLGYRLTMLILVVVLTGVVERRPPIAVALVAAGLSFGTYYLFNNLLRVPLPVGVFGY